MRYIPLPLKIILSFGFPLFGIVWLIACSRELSKTLDDATKTPNAETVSHLIEAWTRIKLSVHNHPDSWRSLRNSWYKINGSSKVPTHLKQQTINLFQKKGLFINNTKIIDNYKQNMQA